jgi:hypothetical protein
MPIGFLALNCNLVSIIRETFSYEPPQEGLDILGNGVRVIRGFFCPLNEMYIGIQGFLERNTKRNLAKFLGKFAKSEVLMGDAHSAEQ